MQMKYLMFMVEICYIFTVIFAWIAPECAKNAYCIPGNDRVQHVINFLMILLLNTHANVLLNVRAQLFPLVTLYCPADISTYVYL